jgi:hypothetical protein
VTRKDHPGPGAGPPAPRRPRGDPPAASALTRLLFAFLAGVTVGSLAVGLLLLLPAGCP